MMYTFRKSFEFRELYFYGRDYLSILDARTYMSDNYNAMKGSEFLRRLRRFARLHRIECQFTAERGKGSHGTIYFGDRRTIIRNLKDELKPGTLHAIMKQLGIEESDLY